jgi:hypothetical protein
MTYYRRTKAKYGNKKVEHAGRTFDSKGEKGCYDMLLLLEKAGEIRDIEQQVSIDLIAGIKYRADFRFWDLKLGQKVLGEYKGMETEVWRLKRKLYKVFGPHRLRVFKGYGLRISVVEEIIPETLKEKEVL